MLSVGHWMKNGKMFAGKSFLWLVKEYFLFIKSSWMLFHMSTTQINLLIRKKVILSPYYEWVNENCNRNCGILNLTEVINAVEKENTDVDDHQRKITNYKRGKENQPEFLDSSGMEHKDTWQCKYMFLSVCLFKPGPGQCHRFITLLSKSDP